LKSAVVLVGIFMRLMNLVNYIFVHQDTRYGLNVACNLFINHGMDKITTSCFTCFVRLLFHAWFHHPQ